MNSFFKPLVGTLLNNKGPQDFPYSIILMRLCLMTYFITGLPGLMVRISFEKAILAMTIDIAFLMLFVYLCLQAFSKSARFVQSLTSLTCVGVFFQLVMFPLLSKISADSKPDESVLGLILVIAIWQFSVFTHIFKESFAVRLPAAIVLTICYIFMSQIVSSLFFPELIQ